MEMRFHSNWKPFTLTHSHLLPWYSPQQLHSLEQVWSPNLLWVNTHYINSPNLSLICPAVLCVWVNGALRKSLVLICAVLLLREHWSKALATTSCWYYPFPEPENNCLCVSDWVFDREGCGNTTLCLFSHVVLQLIQSTSNYITLLIRCAWVIFWWVILSNWSK